MPKAGIGNKVNVHFTGYLEDGTVFGSTKGENPFEFVIGDKNMLPGFENAVIGMKEGDTKTITIPPEEAYGSYNKQLVHIIDRKSFPQEIKLDVGKKLKVRTKDGNYRIVTVKHLDKDNIVIDGNDPLAGQTLIFKIELVDIL